MLLLTIGAMLIGGLVLLTLGAEGLVRGASRLAAVFGIPSLVIGLTVVAFGTSAPELAVSVKSAFIGQADIALGNVVGSNICNVLFILGICAAILPLKVDRQLIHTDVPVMIAVAVIMLLMALDGRVSRLDGAILVFGLVLYVLVAIKQGRANAALRVQTEELDKDSRNSGIYLLRQCALVGGGLAFLVFGATLFVNGSVEVARLLGVSELVIGLTVVAVGTSLPEAATSVVAAIRGERDIAIGNVVGSNIFNILCVLGLTAFVTPVHVSPVALSFDIPVMVVVMAVCLPVFYSGMTISRKEGVMLLGYYVAYLAYLVMVATQSSALSGYGYAIVWIAFPLTAIGLALGSWKEWSTKRIAG